MNKIYFKFDLKIKQNLITCRNKMANAEPTFNAEASRGKAMAESFDVAKK